MLDDITTTIRSSTSELASAVDARDSTTSASYFGRRAAYPRVFLFGRLKEVAKEKKKEPATRHKLREQSRCVQAKIDRSLEEASAVLAREIDVHAPRARTSGICIQSRRAPTARDISATVIPRSTGPESRQTGPTSRRSIQARSSGSDTRTSSPT